MMLDLILMTLVAGAPAETATAPAEASKAEEAAPAKEGDEAKGSEVKPVELTGDPEKSKVSLDDVGLGDEGDATEAKRGDGRPNETPPAQWDGQAAGEAAGQPPAPAQPTPAAQPAAKPPVSMQPAGAPPRRDRPARPDRDIDWRLELLGGAGSSFVPHSSFGLFDQKDRRMSNAGASFRFDRKLSSLVWLGGGLEYRFLGSDSGDVLGDESTEIDFHEMNAFMRASFVPLEGLDVYVAGGLGPSFVDYTIWANDTARGKSVEILGQGDVGVMLYMPKAWLPAKGAARLTFGLDLGVGYVYRTPIDIQPSIELDEEPLDHDFPDLGAFRASSITWRTGFFIRFI
jgi:hypothetical protein